MNVSVLFWLNRKGLPELFKKSMVERTTLWWSGPRACLSTRRVSLWHFMASSSSPISKKTVAMLYQRIATYLWLAPRILRRIWRLPWSIASWHRTAPGWRGPIQWSSRKQHQRDSLPNDPCGCEEPTGTIRRRCCTPSSGTISSPCDSRLQQCRCD